MAAAAAAAAAAARSGSSGLEVVFAAFPLLPYLPRLRSLGRKIFQKAHFFTLCPSRILVLLALALSTRTSRLIGVCTGQYVLVQVPSADKLGFL